MISVVVTVYNEWELLPDLMLRLRGLSERAEVVVVDGSSTDGTYEVLESLRDAGERWFSLARSPKCRGSAFNCGARMAQGEALLFLHADCALPEDALQQAEEALKRAPAGCFRIRFDAPGLFMRWNELASNARARTGIMFGDQAMFMSRDLFWQMGGFVEQPLMEDYEFSLALKARGIRPAVARGPVVASPRRYANGRRGQLGTALHMIWLRVRYRLGHSANELDREYDSIR